MNIIKNTDIQWAGGWYMDIHSYKSTRTPEGFNTDRSKIGQILYNYKYGKFLNGGGGKIRAELATELADTMFNFIKSEDKLKYISTVSWVPSSKPRVNPVLEPIAIRLAKRIKCNFDELITRKKNRESVKHKSQKEINEILDDAFELNIQACKSYDHKKVLLIDDLFRTGTTFKKIAKLIKDNSSICLYGLAITKTRTTSND